MCKFKFTSGAKPSLMEKKLLTSTHHMMRNHQPNPLHPSQPYHHQSQTNQPSPQSRQKPLDFLTQQQLLGKLLVNEQAKLVNANPTRINSKRKNSTSSFSNTNSTSGRTHSNPSSTSLGYNNYNRSDTPSPFNVGEDFKDLNPARSDFKTEFPDLSLMDFSSPRMDDPMMSSLVRSTSSDMLSASSGMLSPSSDVEMNDESDGTSNDVPDYNAAFSLPPLSPVETLGESFQRTLSDSLLNRQCALPRDSRLSPLVNERDSPRFCDNSPVPTLNRRKSRKSQAREKLEKTFKEKGFLIQTQQLESAEGATYCKFRQLRKFTRYLFRSWKTHLPGEVVDETYDMQ